MLKYVATNLSLHLPTPCFFPRCELVIRQACKQNQIYSSTRLLRVICVQGLLLQGEGEGLWVQGCYREEGSEAQGSPATGILSSNYRDNKWDKWSVTRLTTERKWEKEIGLAPSEGHSLTHVLLQKHVMSSQKGRNDSHHLASPIQLKVRLGSLSQANLPQCFFKFKTGWTQLRTGSPGCQSGACTNSVTAPSPVISGQCLPQSLRGAGNKRIANSHNPPPKTPRAALQEKLVGDVLCKNTQIQLTWHSLDSLSHHH